jgi:hypothetical protein
MQVTAPISTPTTWADTAARGTESIMRVSEYEEGIARHSEQPAFAVREYEEHSAPHHLNGRSDQFDEHVQVDATTQVAKCSIENLSVPSHPPLAPASNVVVLVESSEEVVEERRDAAMFRYK